jgi:3-hydroxybutyryl-CoA dehydrogenase
MKSIRHIGICGLGQMGAAAAVSFKRAGYQVMAWNHRPERLEALPGITATLEAWMDQHMGPAPDPSGTLQTHDDLRVLDEQVDVVLDCIAEDMAVKVDLFNQFPASKDRSALFLTTTSGLSITEIGRLSGCANLIAGTHFWNPPHLMPLVEVVRGQDTPDTVIDQVCELVKSIGKTPVRVERDVPGFIGNRLLHALWREAIHLVEHSIATPEDIDRVARLTFGLRMPAVGPLENMDLVGLDLIEKIHTYLLEDLADNHGPSPHLTRHVQEGDLGMKSGRGFYDWQSRSGENMIQKRDIQIVHQLNFLKQLENKPRGLQS